MLKALQVYYTKKARIGIFLYYCCFVDDILSWVERNKVQEADPMVRAGDPYADLADLYDSMTHDSSLQALYREWRDSLLHAIKQYKVKVRVIADLACGTGNTTVPWTRRHGWTVVGVDRSAAMLREAQKKSSRVRWYCQDMRNLHLEERADVVTCHFDALSHILAPQDLQQIFINVAQILNKGGLFQFDLNTEHWFRWLSAHEKSFRLGANYLTARNEYDSRRRLATFHQVWFVQKGHMYEKREVKVQERAYTTAEIRRMIIKARLRLLKMEIQRKLEGKPIRILYLVEKPEISTVSRRQRVSVSRHQDCCS